MKDLKQFTITTYKDENDKEGSQFLTFAKEWATAREQAIEVITFLGNDIKRFKMEQDN